MKELAIFGIIISVIFLFSSCDSNPLETGGKKLAEINLVSEYAWGTESTDDFAGSVIDADGNMYILSSSSGTSYITELNLVKISLLTDSLIWSKTISSSYSLFFPSPSENGVSQGGAGSRCIAIDADGNIYIAGTCTKGYHQVFVVKVNPYGNVVWQQNWEANDSGVAHGSAKAYALDVNNNRVYVTGTTGAGVSNEESNVFLLMLDVWSGDIYDSSTLGLDPSAGYNDRGYTVKATDDGDVYIGGWEGKNNSGLLVKYSANGDTFDWCKRVGLGIGCRITDIDIDDNDDIYLACDFRGVSTYLGVLKLNPAGSVIWAKKYQGRNNDINNISCLRVINSELYIGGRGSFEKYDLSQFGDGCILKMDLSGNLLSEMNYFTGEEQEDNCGERIESINFYYGNLILAGETWPEYGKIAGHWYVPEGSITDFTPQISAVSDLTRTSGLGYSDDEYFGITANSYGIFPLSNGSKGSADVIVFKMNVN